LKIVRSSLQHLYWLGLILWGPGVQQLGVHRISRWWSRASGLVRVVILDGLILIVVIAFAFVGDSLHILQGHGQWFIWVGPAVMMWVMLRELMRRPGNKF
jgi:hypothetical protein